MRQQVCKNKSWKKRVAAAGMAICMACTMPFSVQAENVTEEYNVQEDFSTESAEENVSDEKSEVQSYDIETAQTVNQEDSAAEEPSKEEVQLSLQLVAVENTDTTTPNLTLDEADKLSENITVKKTDSNTSIEVKDGKGLILLSNVKPEEYANCEVKLITTSGWDLTNPVKVGVTTEVAGTEYSFLGLGSDDNPYAGTFGLDSGTDATKFSISTTRPLFNALSVKATFNNTIPFSIAESTKEPLLAKTLKATVSGDGIEENSALKCDIELRSLEAVTDAAIGGLIGTMEGKTSADITFTNQLTSDLTISGTDHVGLFCNTMNEDSSLTATFKNGAGKISVAATESGKDAGGFVGHMETDASLTIAGTSVSSVASSSGNAGGIVGSSVDGSVTVKASKQDTNTNIFQFADSITLSAGSDKAAGGLIGSYSITKAGKEFNLSSYQFAKSTITGGKNAGGLFGELIIKNTAETDGISVSISGNTENFDNITKTITTEVSSAVTNYGGLIGSYSAENMASSLSIKANSNQPINVISTGGSKTVDSGSYGGVIGEISDNSYVEIENISVFTADMKFSENARFGGLVGTVNNGLLNVGSVTLETANGYDLAVQDQNNNADNVKGHGGLVGYLEKGVLRLHGATNLENQKITVAYNHVGQIVGNNNNGLVYALGDGNTLSESGEGWSLTRYSGTNRSGSDIGNWGAVVRLGNKLTEGADGAFTFDEKAHTVTVNNGTGENIGNTNNFVAYALAFDISKEYESNENSALKFNNIVKTIDTQKVTLSGDVDLTGTGIIGIGKDNTEKGKSAQTFTGTFDGGSNTVTLDIGTTYGANISENDNAAGQLYAKRSDQRDTHYSLALIPFAQNVTVKNITIEGKVNSKVPKTVKQEETETDVRYPAFASGVIGLASGTATFENVTVNTVVSVKEETSTDEKLAAKKLHTWQSGFLGRFEGTQLTYQDCVWGSSASLTEERSTDNARMGGLAAEVMGDAKVTVKNCTLSGMITSNAPSNARVGGLIAVSRGETQTNANNTATSSLSTINIANLQVNGENISAKTATATSGGLLGYQWQNTNVVFAPADSNENSTGNSSKSSTGVTISGSSLTSSNAQFGGLVYQATGYWNAAAKDSIVFSTSYNKATNLTGKSAKDVPSGLLVGTGLIKETVKENNTEKEVVKSALYLEVGTWGSASDAAYQIVSNAVTLNISNSAYFDELVGITKFNDAGNGNAVVSLAVRDDNGNAAKIDTENLNTYIGQINNENYKNDKTRYYYNLDSYRKNNKTLNVDSVSTPENLVLWSVAQYVAPNIRGCFRKGENTDVIITDEIDLTGYSYYPVTPIGAVNLGNNQGKTTSLNFEYEGMNEKENENKKLSDSDHQHYLMQHGLFYNAYRNIAVKNTSFSGTVGKEPIEKDGTTYKYNSGALIYGSVVGDSVKYIVEIMLNRVTLAGIRVTDVEKDKVTYAPLLINQMEKAVKLTVDTLSTGEGYTTENDSDKTVYAATSLIGNVGNNNATKLTLSFSNIALDGRVAADKANATSVYNNGKVQVEYNTTHTIFTNATLLESFMYSSEGSGTYNFNSTDKMVTYGVELTNTGSTGRNPDKQYQYYDGEIYITDEKDKTADEVYVKGRYKDTNFIRYVHIPQNIINSQYELDINQKTSGLLKGCGTYGDPYIIEDAHQLSSLAAYIEKPESVKKFQAMFNSKVLTEKKQTADSYHLQGGATGDATGNDIIYTWENGAWTNGTQENTGIDKDTATKYLLNAYYKIDKDITLSAESFSGLGTKDNPFSGVIVGTNSTAVKIIGTNSNKDSFGGLIAYSRGSVVKDLKVDYTLATIQMQAGTLPGTAKNPFFGGVVGYCMGGDTIIDNVSVNYEANSVTFSDTYQYMIAAGGYVGLVGGATHVTEDTDYEKTGGGVVFRNMTGTTNTFTTVCAEAAAKNKTVNMLKEDGTPDGKTATDDGNYFYRNPYVGRVLDGYACAEECTINNTDKNYTIPTLTLNNAKNDLQVTEEKGILTATVTSAQGLWLLSAIVNSGAGAMDSNGSYTDVPNNKNEAQVVDAYQYGKPRTASYKGIGESGDAAAKLADEAYWGGIASTAESDYAKDRVSYLVNNYTTGKTAARLAGKSCDTKTNTNIPVNLTFSADSIDMTNYGNGFRGIGCSYGRNRNFWNSDCSIPEVYRRNLLVNNINDDKKEATTIKLKMNQNEYNSEYMDGPWKNQGAGLFVDFHFKDQCQVNQLIISGNIKFGLFNIKDSTSSLVNVKGDNNRIGVGGFAARTANSAGTVTFDKFSLNNINVYGGTITGGAIGYIDGYSSNDPRNVTFNNWSIENANVSKWVHNDGSTGGLVGWNIGYGTLNIEGDINEKVNISNLKVTTISNEYRSAAAGGLVGACDFSSVSISKVNAKYLTVTGKQVRDIGGLIAGERNGTGKDVSVENCVLHTVNVDNSTKNESSTGGIIGYHNGKLNIKSVTLDKDSTINGQQYTGGFVGQSNADVSIDACSEKNVSVKSDNKNWVGGFIGYLGKSVSATFQNCQAQNVNILGRYVGGLVGAIDGSITASNMEFKNVMAVTKYKDTKFAGLITGNTRNSSSNNNDNSIKCYNILADSCKTGYSNVIDVKDLQTAKLTQIDTSGLWIGKNGANTTANTTTNLVAVAAKGNVFPQKDIGTDNANNTVIIYADKTAEKTYTPPESTANPSSSANPWLDVNPKSDVPFADGTVMTGNAVGMLQTAEPSAKREIARTILSELNDAKPASDYYWNLADNKNEFVNFLDSTNDAYITTYRAEERATTTVSENVDFPVLVVNNSAEVDAMLWNYIAAMTNVSSGYIAKTQIKSITAKSYKWDATAKNFKAQDSASLKVSETNKITIVPNAYDNQSSQFTLLDVTYADPTDSKNTHVFHLYVPVLVKKVLYISFKTRFIAGTDYCAADYPMNDNATDHYATAGFNEPLTAYIEYSYEKETDWQSMLDNGENLLWYYDKVLDLAFKSSEESGKKLLPTGTRLTLVDRQTMQYYTYTTTGEEDFHKFNLSNLQLPSAESSDTSENKNFKPVYICDLLGLTATKADLQDEAKTYYVKVDNKDTATVRVGNEYYRKAEEEDIGDKNVTKYSIAIFKDSSSEQEARKESYFLTIQVPESKEYSVINNRLNYSEIKRNEGTLPAVIKSEKEQSGSAYVIYDGVSQTFTISTSRIHNGNIMGDTAMEDSDSIKINLESKLKLTEAGKDKFDKLGPSEVHHQFTINLKKYLQGKADEYDVIGTEIVKYTYTFKNADGTWTHTETGTISDAAGKDILSLQYGSSDLKKELEKATDDANAITVTAEITLTYASADKFPVRNTADTNDASGICVAGVSRIANTQTQLPITENKCTEDDKNRYYSTNPSKAKLTYSAVDQTAMGDTTQQLGINPSDTVNPADIIYTKADYDYSNVDETILKKAKSISYRMELFQKNDLGSYDETNPLIIQSYLQNVVKESSAAQESAASRSATDGKYIYWKEDFANSDSRHQIAHFQYAPLTGEAFEAAGYTYANYRVRVTVVLLDNTGNELEGTKATDYIIYTNARIYQKIIMGQN